jgi:hypothetical protein
METQASLAPAHASAFMFIDAIEPHGRLLSGVYDRIRDIFSRLAPYEKYLGGNLAAEIAIYVSSESRFDFRESGLDTGAYGKQADNMAALFTVPHMDAVMGSARALQEAHLPFATVTRQDLARLSDYRVIVLPNVLVMSDEEIAAFRKFVADGGALYASGYSSLVDMDGRMRDDFGLADVFGITKAGSMKHELAFFTPAERFLGQAIFPQEHLIHQGGRLAIKNAGAKVVALLTEPWCPVAEGTVFKPSFSSIHSTPPGPTGREPGITWHRHGRGRACYAAGAIEAEKPEINRAVFVELVRRLLGRAPSFEADAPPHVEMTVFDRPERRILNIGLVSLRESDDVLTCGGKIRARLDKGRRVVALRSLPNRKRIPYRADKTGAVEFSFHEFGIFALFELQYADAQPTPQRKSSP